MCVSCDHIERFNDRGLKRMVGCEFVANVNLPLRQFLYSLKHSWVHWLKWLRYLSGFRQHVYPLTKSHVVMVRVRYG